MGKNLRLVFNQHEGVLQSGLSILGKGSEGLIINTCVYSKIGIISLQFLLSSIRGKHYLNDFLYNVNYLSTFHCFNLSSGNTHVALNKKGSLMWALIFKYQTSLFYEIQH